jgi:hypothetical protein
LQLRVLTLLAESMPADCSGAEAASLAARCRAVAAPYRAMRPNYMNLKNKKIGTAFVRQEGPGSSRASAGTEKIV